MKKVLSGEYLRSDMAKYGVVEKIYMTVSRSKGFVLVDKKQNINKKQVFIFGSIIASACLSGAFLIALYIEYLHNPALHSFVQARGIFL